MIAAQTPRLFDAQGRELSFREEKTWGMHDDWPQWGSTPPPGYGSGYKVSNPLEQLTWVYSCIHRKSTALSMINFRLVLEDQPDEEIEYGPMYDLMDHPNPTFEMDDLIQSISINLDQYGEAHLWVGMAPGGKRARELWPFNPAMMSEVVDQSTDRLIGWDYQEQGRARR
jgi:phage portal protein BeeE